MPMAFTRNRIRVQIRGGIMEDTLKSDLPPESLNPDGKSALA